jgi:adenosylcobyric acid synthase
VAIINFAHMSNFNDFEPLIADDEVAVEFISGVQNLDGFDLIILPGTKSTIADLQWLKKSGLFEKIQMNSCKIYGVCGGYQMMFESISDLKCVENDDTISESGFGFFEGEITFEEEKIVRKGSYEAFGLTLEGFEIHNGISKEHSIFCEKGRFSGSFLHGIFDNESFREYIFRDFEYVGFDFKEYKKNKIADFVQSVKEHLDVQRILDSVR